MYPIYLLYRNLYISCLNIWFNFLNDKNNEYDEILTKYWIHLIKLYLLKGKNYD